ncbi:MAG: hypothetical protein J0I41_02370 [Filimonas sp.]|nr:hypothetical protein [Filimonas sp.]
MFTALLTLTKAKPAWWKSFIAFMVFTCIIEVIAYRAYFVHHVSNHGIFNIYLPVEVLFVSFVLYKICQPYFKSGPVFIAGSVIFLIAYFIESFKSRFGEYSSAANNIASAFFIIMCCVYYYCLLRKEETVDIVIHPAFWIVSGCFFFYFGGTACNFFFTYLSSLNTKTFIPVRYIIFIILNFILYACWSYAFICKYKHKISSS